MFPLKTSEIPSESPPAVPYGNFPKVISCNFLGIPPVVSCGSPSNVSSGNTVIVLSIYPIENSGVLLRNPSGVSSGGILQELLEILIHRISRSQTKPLLSW